MNTITIELLRPRSFWSRFNFLKKLLKDIAPRQSMFLTADTARRLYIGIEKHIASFNRFQSSLGDSRAVAAFESASAEARRLVSEIESLHCFEAHVPLLEARRVLVDHWRSSWSNGGISEFMYRSRLKGAMLYLRDRFRIAPI